MLDSLPVRVLDAADLPAATAHRRARPGRERVRAVAAAGRRAGPAVGGETLGPHRDGRLHALCWLGANVVPVEADAAAIAAFAERAKRLPRGAAPRSSGRAEHVLPLWHAAGSGVGARARRAGTPTAAGHRPRHRGRRTRPRGAGGSPDELDVLLPACVAMFTEEVGVIPLAGDGGALYRARVAELLETRRAYARIEDGQVIFKAEIGAASAGVCQIQGVWVNPAHRGRGLAAAGMARRRRTGPARGGADREPVRQRLQPARAGHLPPGGVPRSWTPSARSCSERGAWDGSNRWT